MIVVVVPYPVSMLDESVRRGAEVRQTDTGGYMLVYLGCRVHDVDGRNQVVGGLLRPEVPRVQGRVGDAVDS